MLGVAAWAFDRALKSITEAQRTAAKAISDTIHREFAQPAAPQLPPEQQGNAALFQSFMDSPLARTEGTGAIDPTDTLVAEFDGDRPAGGRVATVPAGTFGPTGGNLVEAFKRGQFGGIASGVHPSAPPPGDFAGEAFDG